MPTIATKTDRGVALILALSAGAFLAMGFLPVSQQIVDVVLAPFLPGRARILAWASCAAFPLLACVFWLSAPRPQKRPPSDNVRVWLSLLPPIGIALLYGVIDPRPGIFQLPASNETQLAIAWVLFFTPLGEEFLFRGWLYAMADKIAKQRFLTMTNPLPVAVWVSGMAFSVWHFQNLSTDPWGTVLFQVAYTLPAGLWLGWVRWRTGGLLAPCVAHLGLNFAAALF